MSPGRNEPCPCGSGRKYKHCCGKPSGREGRSGSAPGLPPEAVERARNAPEWEADMVSLPALIQGKDRYRTVGLMVVADEIVVWSDMRLVTATEVMDVAAALEEAVVTAAARVGVFPEAVLVRRRQVADALRPLLLERECDVTAEPLLPGLDPAVSQLAEHLSKQPGWPAVTPPSTWAAWGLPLSIVKELFSAYARFYRAAPWRWFDTAPPIIVEWDDSAGPWVVSVMGSSTGEHGMAIYSSLWDYEETLAWNEDTVPFQGLEGWVVHLGYQHRRELPRSMVKEVSAAGWEVADVAAYPYILPMLTPGGGLERDRVRRLAEVMNAVASLGDELGEKLRSPAGVTVIKNDGRLRLRYFVPPEEVAPGSGVPVAAYNAAPQEGLAGISPDQAQALLAGGVEGDGPLKLTGDLNLDELADADFLVNAREFLSAADASGGAPATKAGNLKRAFVAEMLERMRLPPGYLDGLHRMNKVVNEGDVGPLHVLRVNLELAKLMRKRKGRFVLTRTGRDLASPDAAGALYRHLFQVHFGEFNLSYMKRIGDDLGLQYAFPLLLWKMKTRAKNWISLGDLVGAILPESVIRAGTGEEGYRWRVDLALDFTILQPLLAFGLLEEGERERSGEETRSGWDPEATLVRITPLFGRFLSFEWE